MIKIKIVKRPDTDAIHRKMVAAVAREYAAMGRETKDQLEEPVNDWQVGPSIYYQVGVDTHRWRLGMYHRSRMTGGMRYNWVRLGTRPHPIRAVRATTLRFRMPHSPRTLAPGQTRPTGTPRTVYAPEVMHPGIQPRNEARNFPGYVYRHWFKNRAFGDTFFRRTERAVKDALRSMR